MRALGQGLFPLKASFRIHAFVDSSCSSLSIDSREPALPNLVETEASSPYQGPMYTIHIIYIYISVCIVLPVLPGALYVLISGGSGGLGFGWIGFRSLQNPDVE